MASSVNPPRGMRDFLPADKARRERVLSVIRESYRAHGFDEIETPVMEDSSRLHAGLGGDNEKLAFGVIKRGLSIEEIRSAQEPLDLTDLGLRFDLTVPLARYYATHRAELPSVFRAIQIAPVWRAERPQKGRYRQFVQCDIDIIGEAGPSAEIELIIATVATLRALGVEGCTIRVNDRRILVGTLTALGFAPSSHEAALITVDKLDKLGVDGVIAELRERGFEPDAVAALESLLRQPKPHDSLFGVEAIRAGIPEGVDTPAVAELALMGEVAGRVIGSEIVRFDPWLVRGMGYYTGAIFEVEHPDLSYSLGGGGRYDAMIGRFLSTEVPAVGFSLGFERLIDLVELPETDSADAVVLVHDAEVPLAQVASLQSELIARGLRVRRERRPRNLAPLLAQLAASGFSRVATVTADSTADSLEFRSLVQ